MYYASTCAPCQLDLPVAAALVKQNSVKLRIVIIGNAPKALADLKAVSSSLVDAAETTAEQNPRAVLRSAGDSDGILPYARTRDNGKTCATWRGRLSLDKALQMIAACRQRLTAPPSR
jgi:thiol-disulfide isomerase/thioredoxin